MRAQGESDDVFFFFCSFCYVVVNCDDPVIVSSRERITRMGQNRAGEMFVYPRHITCDCPESRHPTETKKLCHEINVDYTIEKLRQLVSDPVTDVQVSRISRLLDDYLHEIGEEGYVSFLLAASQLCI